MIYKDSIDTLPSKLYLAEQIKQGEQLCAERLGLDMYQLMERAGHDVFDCVLAKYADAEHIFVLAGTGNNGGDAYVVARLINQSNMDLTVFSPQPERILNGDAEIARQAYLSSGGNIVDLSDLAAKLPQKSPKLIVDGLLGTGTSGELREPYKIAITLTNESAAQVIAIDLPSGLDADTGCVRDLAINADYTVTFVALKTGLVTACGPDQCGVLLYSGLGIDQEFEQQIVSYAHWRKSPLDLMFHKRKYNSHKGTFGHVVCIGGAPGMPGAIYMTAKSALRSGAGKVSVFTHPDNVSIISMLCPELMVFPLVPDDTEFLYSKIVHADVIAVGPGLSESAWGNMAFKQVLENDLLINTPTIIDADAINLLAKTELAEWFHTRVPKWVLTPHPLEAARLLGWTTSNVNNNRLLASKKIAEQFKATVVLKGAGSVITDGNEMSINASGNPGMASAGMGDVLTGVIAGQIANFSTGNMNLQNVVEKSVFLHGFAGDLTAKNGEIGMIATDVIEFLPKALKACLNTP